MRRVSVVAISLVVAATVLAAAAGRRYSFTGKVVSIADGETLSARDTAQAEHKIHLQGIDSPEKGQAFATEAKDALSSKILGQMVRVDVVELDRSRREVGRVYFGDRFINLEMIRDGFAWRYPPSDRHGEFTPFEGQARALKRGLWADPHPVPPWEFRRRKRAAGQ
jgi:micrococcal nuclease